MKTDCKAILDHIRHAENRTPGSALLEMRRDANERLRWVEERLTHIVAGTAGHTQPDTNLDGIRMRMVCNETDGWHDTFIEAALKDIRAEVNALGESFAWVVIRNGEKLRTRLKGYIVEVTPEALIFFDGPAVNLADIVEVAR